MSAAPAYYRHRPEQTELYAIIAKHYPRFVFAHDPQALSAVLAVVQRAISSFVIQHSELTVASAARTR